MEKMNSVASTDGNYSIMTGKENQSQVDCLAQTFWSHGWLGYFLKGGGKHAVDTDHDRGKSQAPISALAMK